MKRYVVPLSLTMLAALAVIVILLAAGVERVEYGSGRPFDEDLSAPVWPTLGGGEDQPLRTADKVVAYGIFGLCVAAVILYVRRNAGREGLPPRKTRRWVTVVVAFTVFAAILVLNVDFSPDDEELDDLGDKNAIASDGANEGPAPYQTIDELLGTGDRPTGAEGTPAALLIGALLGVVAAIAVAALVVPRLRRIRPAETAAAPEEILASVRRAVLDLRAGRDPSGVVEECYRRMLRILAEQSNVNPTCLTPREFVQALVDVGLKKEAIGKLSELFERVHYGHRADGDFAGDALRCMTAISAAYPEPEVAS